jgi:hypothetical protein
MCSPQDAEEVVAHMYYVQQNIAFVVYNFLFYSDICAGELLAR